MDASTLLKFLAQVGELPQYTLGSEHDRSERLLKWRAAVATLLKSTPALVRYWRAWAWNHAEHRYNQWVLLYTAQMNRYPRQLGPLPPQFELVNGWAYCRSLEKLPPVLKGHAQQREAGGECRNVADELFELMKLARPGGAPQNNVSFCIRRTAQTHVATQGRP